MTIRDLYDALEARIPRSYSCSWDNDGLACCPDPEKAVRGVLVALDATEDAIAAAEQNGCNLLLTHHPLLFRGLRAVNGGDTSSRKVIRMIRAGISCASFHTRLDALPGGVNDVLASVLGLQEVQPFGSGVGEDGNPAGMPLGRIGTLLVPESFGAFCERVKAALHLPALVGAGCGCAIRRVAVLGGAGRDDVDAARAAGADLFLTGELGYHQLCDAPYSGMALIAAGHYHTEFPIVPVLADMVRGILSPTEDAGIPILLYGEARVEIR